MSPDFSTNDALQQFSVELGCYTQESTTLNFRHCYAAYDIENNNSWLEATAEWSGRTVTGSSGSVQYYGSEVSHYTRPDSPDYYYTGPLYQVDPDGCITELYERDLMNHEERPY